MKDIIQNIIEKTLKGLHLPVPGFSVDYPKNQKFGDFSSNVSLLLSKELKRNPREIAEELLPKLSGEKCFSKVEIAGAGFLNFFVADSFYREILKDILNKKESYGRLDINKGKTADLEWVSANPTGPLHAGHGRQVCLGKAIANLLEWTGYDLTREYYYNDAGNQMNNLAKSVYARYMQKFDPDFPFPDDGYAGDYIKEIAEEIYNEKKNSLKDSEDISYFKKKGEESNFNRIKNTLAKFGIQHNVFFSETALYKNGDIEKLLKLFEDKGASRVEEGATWLIMDKDRFQKDKVIVKATGEPTYRLPDMAYHINKVNREFDLMVDIFGSDHGDTYKEVLYGMELAGYETQNIKVIIHQMVTFKMGEESVKMSKRSDNVYYLDDLIDDVGVDATQLFFVMRSANTHLDFDIELAKDRSDKNPVYYLQYAHARICGIFRNAEENIKDFNEEYLSKEYVISEPEALELIKVLSKFPEEVKSSYEVLEPHKLIYYLNSVAEMFHKFYHNNRIINLEDMDRTYARLQVCESAKKVLKNGFSIIGISAPERM
ncbi:MAG: arginine--tRNA ligase [Ignavibacteriae bacterium]|nr:arginine--tRNA ligase [Ignavibacteriota bacterium]